MSNTDRATLNIKVAQFVARAAELRMMACDSLAARYDTHIAAMQAQLDKDNVTRSSKGLFA